MRIVLRRNLYPDVVLEVQQDPGPAVFADPYSTRDVVLRDDDFAPILHVYRLVGQYDGLPLYEYDGDCE